MKSSTLPVVGFHLVAAIILAGCAATGISGRIQEKSTEFAQLDPATQNHVRGGNVERGYTQDMVYIALGKPSKTETRESPDGPIEVWIYKNMLRPNTGGFQGLTYNVDHNITPGYAPNASVSSQQASGQGGTYGQQGNYVNNDAMSAAAELPDLAMGTFYIFFFQGRVYKMNMTN